MRPNWRRRSRRWCTNPAATSRRRTAFPTAALGEAVERTNQIWADLADAEATIGLTRSREPELGFVAASYHWAKHEPLSRVLRSAAAAGVEMSAGDFVRWCKQLLDLLEQIASTPTRGSDAATVAHRAREASAAIRRGVVAQGMAG